MARPHRLDEPGARHHVMNRGARRREVFLDDRDRACFLRRVSQLPERFAVEVHGYALMPNHFHLLVHTPSANLSVAMHWLGTSFSSYLNAAHGWDGPVFRGRFRNRIVDSDAYWRHLLAYVHLNPVRGGLAPSLDASRWTSHRAYVGRSAPRWLTVDEIRGLFGSASAYRAYVDALVAGAAAPVEFDAEALWRPSTSDRVGEAGPKRATSPSPWSVEQRVAEITGETVWRLRNSRRGADGDLPAQLLVWALHRVAGLSYAQIGRRLGVSGTAVSARARRFALAVATDPAAAGWVSEMNASRHVLAGTVAA